MFTGVASAGCDPSPPAHRPARVEVPACPGLFVKLLPTVEAVVRGYKQANGLGTRRTLYYVDVDSRRGEEQQMTVYSSLLLSSVFTYYPESYSQVGTDYVALCSGVASLGDPVPRAQAICDVLSQGWYGKRLTRAEVESQESANYNPPIWRVVLKEGGAMVVDSTASLAYDRTERVKMRFVPPPHL